MSLSNLPHELLCLTVTFLDDEDLESFMLVAKFAHQACTSDIMWQMKYMYELGSHPVLTCDSYREQYYLDELISDIHSQGEERMCELIRMAQFIEQQPQKSFDMTIYRIPSYNHTLTMYRPHRRPIKVIPFVDDEYMFVEDIEISLDWRPDEWRFRIEIQEKTYNPRRLFTEYDHVPESSQGITGTDRGLLKNIDDLVKYIQLALDEGYVAFDDGRSIVPRIPEISKYFEYVRRGGGSNFESILSMALSMLDDFGEEPEGDDEDSD